MRTIIVILSILGVAWGLDNGLARTPPMGWMSWERFRCITDCKLWPEDCISEKLFMEMADVMVSEGYKDAGYEYVNIDDCWSEKQRVDGRIVPDKKRFPRGLKFLSDYIHSKGLKFGLYGNYGTYTCAGYPGYLGYEEVDVQDFVTWEIDFIKVDGCYMDIEKYEDAYEYFGQLMNKTGRPILYSCSYTAYMEYANKPYDKERLTRNCNMWRNYGDIDDSYGSMRAIADWFAEEQDRFQPIAAPGHWNDPDTLLLGNYGLSYDQSKAQLAMWAVMAAPFLISNDLRKITPDIKELLLNRDIIAVDQDKLGIQGRRVKDVNRIETWVRPVEPIINGEYSFAVAFVSKRTDGAAYGFNYNIEDLKLNATLDYEIYDLFAKKLKMTRFRPGNTIFEKVNPTGANFYKFIPKVKQTD